MLCKATLVVAFLLALNTLPCHSVIVEHVVEALPGWSGDLPTLQFSGYLKLSSSNEKHFFYWFVLSENDPMNDPVVLWLNGGPGCSSLYGYFVEQGPLHFNTNTYSTNDSMPTLKKNPYSWNKLANVLYVESPVGTGFSYSTDNEDYTTTDGSVANDNMDFLLQFFENYKEFKNNDFYISGESYAGIYIPMLVNRIQTYNKMYPEENIKLKGFMVGNGCAGTDVGGCGSISGIKIQNEFYYAHAMLPKDLHDNIVQTCDFETSLLSTECIGYVEDMTSTIGNVDVYNIYDTCSKDDTPKHTVKNKRRFNGEMTSNPLKTVLNDHIFKANRDRHLSEKDYDGPDSCIDEVDLDNFMNNPKVRSAIGAKSIAEVGEWAFCSSNFNYIHTTTSLLAIYKMLAKTYRVMIYNGDVDSCVPYVGPAEWTRSFGFDLLETWRPWLVDSQIAGYVTQYAVNNFTFITVKGAGHMVPLYKPKQAYAMFERFLLKKPF